MSGSRYAWIWEAQVQAQRPSAAADACPRVAGAVQPAEAASTTGGGGARRPLDSFQASIAGRRPTDPLEASIAGRTSCALDSSQISGRTPKTRAPSGRRQGACAGGATHLVCVDLCGGACPQTRRPEFHPTPTRRVARRMDSTRVLPSRNATDTQRVDRRAPNPRQRGSRESRALCEHASGEQHPRRALAAHGE